MAWGASGARQVQWIAAVLSLLVVFSWSGPAMAGQTPPGSEDILDSSRVTPSRMPGPAPTPDFESGLRAPTILPAPPTQSLAATAAPQTAAAALARMAALAGVIFAGQVTAVRRPAGSAGSPQSAAEGLIEVEFRVDQAVRGPTAGSQFVLKEWAGLWAGGIDRYQVGQRLLMFLHAPNAQGMSSPIDGMDGVMPLAGNGLAPAAEDTTTTPGTWMVDLRWLEAQVLRETAAEPLSATVRPPTDSRTDDPANSPAVRNAIESEPPRNAIEFSSAASRANPELVRSPLPPILWRAVRAMPQQSATESLQTVLALCREWEQQSHASH
jgi:hypothetical protein